MNKLSLPIDPYLANSTEWFLNGHPRQPGMDLAARYKLYQQWMKDQGVIIKNIVDSREQGIPPSVWTVDFVDESSMIIFILRWGN